MVVLQERVGRMDPGSDPEWHLLPLQWLCLQMVQPLSQVKALVIAYIFTARIGIPIITF